MNRRALASARQRLGLRWVRGEGTHRFDVSSGERHASETLALPGGSWEARAFLTNHLGFNANTEWQLFSPCQTQAGAQDARHVVAKGSILSAQMIFPALKFVFGTRPLIKTGTRYDYFDFYWLVLWPAPYSDARILKEYDESY